MPAGKVSPLFRWRVVPVQTGGGTTLPAWAAALAAGTWGAATTNTMAAVGADAFTREVLWNYNGGVAFPPGTPGYPKGGLWCWGGGHSSSGGGRDTASYAVDLDTRLWRRVSENSAGPFSASGVGTYPLGVYADGKPVPTHTYCYPGFDPVNGLVYIPRGVSSYVASTQDTSGGAYVPFTFILDIATGAWRNGPTSTFTALYRNGGRTVWDDRRGCLWTMPSGGAAARQVFKYFDLNVPNGNGTWGKIAATPYTDNGGTESDGVFLRHSSNPDLDLIVYSQFTSPVALRACPIVGGVPQARITLTMGGTPPPSLNRNGALMWSARRQAILYYDNRQPDTVAGFTGAGAGRSLVYELVAPPENEWRTGVWTWRLLTSTANAYTVPQHVTTSGLYSKARLFAFTDGEVLVAAPRADVPAVAFRIP
jgi:hypothetical protein